MGKHAEPSNHAKLDNIPGKILFMWSARGDPIKERTNLPKMNLSKGKNGAYKDPARKLQSLQNILMISTNSQ